MSPSYSPSTGLFYVQTAERCSLYRKRRDTFADGRPFLGGAVKVAVTLTTASDLVFFGDDSGAFAAADARSGRVLWHFAAGAAWRASPMAYEFDGHELIGVAGGGSIWVFGLVP